LNLGSATFHPERLLLHKQPLSSFYWLVEPVNLLSIGRFDDFSLNKGYNQAVPVEKKYRKTQQVELAWGGGAGL
jgi:hypothetical protein